MELRFRGSFFRDFDKVQNRYVRHAVQEKITEIKKAETIYQISRLKQFRERSSIWYKTEIHTQIGNKIYWILCIIRQNIVELRRIKTESFFKKHF